MKGYGIFHNGNMFTWSQSKSLAEWIKSEQEAVYNDGKYEIRPTDISVCDTMRAVAEPPVREKLDGIMLEALIKEAEANNKAATLPKLKPEDIVGLRLDRKAKYPSFIIPYTETSDEDVAIFDKDNITSEGHTNIKDRAHWMEQNPLRQYMKGCRVGYIEVSQRIKQVIGGNLTPLKLQRMALGFIEPTFGDYMVLADLMHKKTEELQQAWKDWYKNGEYISCRI